MYIYIYIYTVYKYIYMLYTYIYIYMLYTYIYIYTQHIGHMFQGVLEEGIENETKTTPSGGSTTNSTFTGGSQKILHFGTVPTWKVALKEWWLYVCIYTYIYIYNYLHIYHYMFINCFQVFKTDVKCMLSRFNINISIQKTKRGAFVAFSQYRQQLWR